MVGRLERERSPAERAGAGWWTRWRSTRVADHDGAAAVARAALDLAEPGGLRWALLGSSAARCSRCCAASSAAAPRTGRWSASCWRRSTAGRPQPPSAPLMVEPLSPREQAVLRYLPTMMSNQEIASELFVSVNTVKTHLKAIYRKLDVATAARRSAGPAPRAARALAAGRRADLDQLQAQRLDAVEQPVQLGLVADRAVQHGLDRLELARHALEAVQQRAADAAADADLVRGLGHALEPSSSWAGRLVITQRG